MARFGRTTMTDSDLLQIIASLRRENEDLRNSKEQLMARQLHGVVSGGAKKSPRDTDREKEHFLQTKRRRETVNLTQELQKMAAKCEALIAQESRIEELERQLAEVYTCDICRSSYDDETHVPRILKKCGHTLCLYCICQLHAQSQYQSVRCPFCTAITHVFIVDLLPKNYALSRRA
ncbi:hypothetical protein CAEBREN_02508 [Caenorhabditis brenneri]|uniref:RING-type domain-containing protein n=1 Tax=Caenorhabditis brenneri TaxID=135651 RepID=G0P1H9_CAEBE|nr:hypothetical protein CAEBREN_02508 [Caenorhabditis brenneri]